MSQDDKFKRTKTSFQKARSWSISLHGPVHLSHSYSEESMGTYQLNNLKRYIYLWANLRRNQRPDPFYKATTRSGKSSFRYRKIKAQEPVKATESKMLSQRWESLHKKKVISSSNPTPLSRKVFRKLTSTFERGAKGVLTWGAGGHREGWPPSARP